VSGKTLSQHWAEQEAQALPYNVVSLAVCPEDRALLHQRIAVRFQQMIDQGLVDEVRALYERGDLSIMLPSMRCVGYRQVWEYLIGKYSYEEMVERGIIATRQLAKRQITWLRSWPDVHWLNSEDPNLFAHTLKILATSAIL
ncbi:MAG: tRNA (adenosine(37)-N6)-dimethylallyltransferase MiaA, partial [Oleibacter sp.]|nr:tRNA (adenosine(37)-N6)-dimethylallyltransferase MiaA [Thalassolituus sp.]